MKKVETRDTLKKRRSERDMRIVAEVFKHLPARFGPSGHVSRVRLDVLRHVHITPQQLMELDPKRDFHDIPDATREEIAAGMIALTKAARRKGRRKVRWEASTIPCTPYGVEAMRVFRDTPEAHGSFSSSSLRKMVKRAAAEAQVSLAKRGIEEDLSTFTTYHLKRSLAGAASIASGGLVNREWTIQQSPAVQAALEYASASMTGVYTHAAEHAIMNVVNAALTRFLDTLYQNPLMAPKPIALVAGDTKH